MIKELFSLIAAQLKASAPEIRFIDLQDDQLSDNTPPLAYPAALIDIAEIAFQTVDNSEQVADISFTVQFIFTRIERTSNLTPIANQPKAWEHVAILQKAINGLHAYEPNNYEAFEKGQLIRQKDPSYHVYMVSFSTRYFGDF